MGELHNQVAHHSRKHKLLFSEGTSHKSEITYLWAELDGVNPSSQRPLDTQRSSHPFASVFLYLLFPHSRISTSSFFPLDNSYLAFKTQGISL